MKLKPKKTRTPLWVLKIQGCWDGKRKTFIKSEATIKSGVSERIRSRFFEYCSKASKKLAIQTFAERKRLLINCEEFTRMRKLSGSNIRIEEERRNAELTQLKGEIHSLNKTISDKYAITLQSILSAQAVYNAQLIAYFSGVHSKVEDFQIIELSYEDSPYFELIKRYRTEQEFIRKVLIEIRGNFSE